MWDLRRDDEDIKMNNQAAKIKRPTLESLIHEKTGLKVYEFARAVGLPRTQIGSWWTNNRLTLNLLIAGYEREVLGK